MRYFLCLSLIFLCAFSPANVGIFASSQVRATGGGGATCLQGYSGLNIVAEWDATNSSSYSGSGTTWANVVASPFDSESQTAYDLTNNGATFTGTAGTTGAYWAIDSTGDDFTLSGALTQFIKDQHKTTGGEDWWIAVALRYQNTIAANQGLFSTQTDGTAGNGHSVYFRSADYPRALPPNWNFASVTMADNTDYVVIVSHDHTTSTTSVKVGGATVQTASRTYSASTKDGTAFSIADYQGTGNGLDADSRIYAVAMGNAAIDSSDMANILGCYETDHSRDYSP